MIRRESGLPEDILNNAAGFAIRRNPGVTLLWHTRRYKTFRAHLGGNGILFEIGEPEQIICYCEGRLATPEEIRHSIETGLPALREIAESDPIPGAIAALDAKTAEAMRLLGVG